MDWWQIENIRIDLHILTLATTKKETLKNEIKKYENT